MKKILSLVYFFNTLSIIKAQCAFCRANNGTMCYYFYMIKIEEIQQRLREAIEYSHLSQKDIAEKLGVNPSTVSKYMRLDKFPALDTFANLCEILDVSADELLGLK